MGGGKRKFCFQKGKFFVLAESSSKSGKWIALGPDRIVTIPFTLLLLGSSVLVYYIFKYTESSHLAYITVATYLSTLISYLHTALRDPGIIRPSEDNSVENKSTLEPLGYTYCSVCGVYRPPKSYHCSDCNVCYLNHDHHCTFMGQCVAKNNTISFYIFIASILIWMIMLEVLGMTLIAIKPKIKKRTLTSVYRLIRSAFTTSHLRK